jgi:hypothetical protein
LVKYNFTNTQGIIDSQREYFLSNNNASSTTSTTTVPEVSPYSGQDPLETGDFEILKAAILKDKLVIDRVAAETGINKRMLITPLVVEQLRLFNSEREIVKRYFSPLKILGSQTQFSWGIFGLKEKTAIKIEQNLKDKQSMYYIGEAYESALDFVSTTTPDIENERYKRITNEKDHYYSYLYTALYLKQIMHSWEVSGFNIEDKPEILATLFNIGFEKSVPKANPKSGGAEIVVNDISYSFGGLAYKFFYSDKLKEF